MIYYGGGYRFVMRTPRSSKIIFEGDLQQDQCAGINQNGQRCKRMVTLGLPYCFQHRPLRAAPSALRNGGKGLFVNSKEYGHNDIVFRPGDQIVAYQGEPLTEEELEERYGRYTGPYALMVGFDDVIDAALKRGIGAMANSKRIRKECNVELVAGDPGSVYLVATKNIRNNTELFVYYGKEYRFDTKHSTTYQRPRR